MTHTEIKSLIANPNERSYYSKTYAINNEFGILAIVYANNEQDALDEAFDRGKLNSQIMSTEDFKEYSSNGWDDSYTFAGNASEAIWTEYLNINEIKSR